MAERELGIVLRAKDLASRTIAGVNRQLGNIGSNVSRGLSNAVRNVERGIAAIGVAAVGGIAYSLRAAGDFEAQLNTINTVAKATPEVLGQIGEGIRQLARETGTSHADLTAAYYDLVSAGIQAADAQNVLTAANTLAIGGLSTTAEAVDLLTTAINSYGGDASKAGLYADQFAQSIAAGKVTAAELAASFAQVGPLAAQMGIGVDEISASIGLMTAKGTPAAEAFTQIRAAMIALQRQTPEMQRVLGELGIADAALYADTYGLAPLFEKLRAKAEELGIPMIELTGRVEGSMYAAQNAGAEFANYEQALDDVKNASGEAAEQMSERQQGLNYQLGLLRTNLYDAAITIGSRLLPKITPLVQKLAEWAQQNQEGIGKFAEEVADGVERAVQWAMKLDWAMISNTLRTAAGYAKGLIEAFLGMPSWVQVAVVSGWGLNKLTGGALGSILGSVLLGGTKGLLGGLRGSTPVTPMYTKEVGIPGVGGPGGGGGKLPFLPAGFGLGAAAAVALPLVLSGSDNLEAQLAENTAQLNRGEITQAEFNAMWGAYLQKGPFNPDADLNNPVFPTPPPSSMLAGGFGVSDLRAMIARIKAATTLPDTAMLTTRNENIGAVLPDTAMRPVTDALGGMTTKIKDLPPILNRANATLQRVAGIGERQQGLLAAQSGKLAAIEASSGRIASSSAISAAKNFSPTVTVPVKIDNNISIHEWQRTVQSSARAYTPTTPTLL